MVMFVYMGRFVNNLHCREDFWREDVKTYLIGKSFCLPFLWRLSGRNYILLSARGPPCSAGRNSSPGPDFWKLFPYDYRLKCKYIHPWMKSSLHSKGKRVWHNARSHYIQSHGDYASRDAFKFLPDCTENKPYSDYSNCDRKYSKAFDEIELNLF